MTDSAYLRTRLATATVKDETGQGVELQSLWKEQTAIIALVRHFG